MGPDGYNSILRKERCGDFVNEHSRSDPEPKPKHTLGGVYVADSAKIHEQAAKNLGLQTIIFNPGEEIGESGVKVSEGNQAVYVVYEDMKFNQKYWKEVERLKAEANS